MRARQPNHQCNSPLQSYRYFYLHGRCSHHCDVKAAAERSGATAQLTASRTAVAMMTTCGSLMPGRHRSACGGAQPSPPYLAARVAAGDPRSVEPVLPCVAMCVVCCPVLPWQRRCWRRCYSCILAKLIRYSFLKLYVKPP
jgi:hypothetical protein